MKVGRGKRERERLKYLGWRSIFLFFLSCVYVFCTEYISMYCHFFLSLSLSMPRSLCLFFIFFLIGISINCLTLFSTNERQLLASYPYLLSDSVQREVTLLILQRNLRSTRASILISCAWLFTACIVGVK